MLLPWLIIIFMAICNFGFFAYAGIATANAARVAAMYAAMSPSAAVDNQGICSAAREELRKAPGAAGSLADCSAVPVQVPAATLLNSPDGTTNGDVSVSVTYRTVPLFALPGMAGRWDITRICRMRIRPL